MTRRFELMTSDLSLEEIDASLLKGSPFFSLLVKLGIAKPGVHSLVNRTIGFVLITWITTAALAQLQNVAFNTHLRIPYVFDITELARFFIIGPILIAAEYIIEPWLIHVIQHFRRLVLPEDKETFLKLVSEAYRSTESLSVEFILIFIAFLRPHFGDAFAVPNENSWHLLVNGSQSWAYQYSLYVSKPLMILLWLRWIWKYVVWSYLLFAISRLEMRALPTHPDKVGGFAFVAVGQTKFAILAFAFAAQIASTVASSILFEGATLWSFRYLILATVGFNAVVFLSPLLSLTNKLFECKRRGFFEYSVLANQYTEEFHHKWIKGHRPENEQLLGSNDVSALADLANSFEIVDSMKPTVITKNTLTVFAVASLLPFTPLIFTQYPIDDLLRKLCSSFM